MDFSAANSSMDRFGKLRKDVHFTIISNCVHGIKAQSVKMKFFEPIQRIMNEEFAHNMTGHTVEVQSGAPRRAPVSKETLRIAMQKVSGWAKMIVDDVKDDHEAECVRALN